MITKIAHLRKTTLGCCLNWLLSKTVKFVFNTCIVHSLRMRYYVFGIQTLYVRNLYSRFLADLVIKQLSAFNPIDKAHSLPPT